MSSRPKQGRCEPIFMPEKECPAVKLSWMPWRSRCCLMACCGLPVLLAGCAAPLKQYPLQEQFGSTATYSRLFDAPAAKTCEAARRALLSQGYIINRAAADL